MKKRTILHAEIIVLSFLVADFSSYSATALVDSNLPRNCYVSAQAQIDWDGCPFAGKYLSDVTLDGSNLSQINLSGAQLTGVSL